MNQTSSDLPSGEFLGYFMGFGKKPEIKKCTPKQLQTYEESLSAYQKTLLGFLLIINCTEELVKQRSEYVDLWANPPKKQDDHVCSESYETLADMVFFLRYSALYKKLSRKELLGTDNTPVWSFTRSKLGEMTPDDGQFLDSCKNHEQNNIRQATTTLLFAIKVARSLNACDKIVDKNTELTTRINAYFDNLWNKFLSRAGCQILQTFSRQYNEMENLLALLTKIPRTTQQPGQTDALVDTVLQKRNKEEKCPQSTGRLSFLWERDMQGDEWQLKEFKRLKEQCLSAAENLRIASEAFLQRLQLETKRLKEYIKTRTEDRPTVVYPPLSQEWNGPRGKTKKTKQKPVITPLEIPTKSNIKSSIESGVESKLEKPCKQAPIQLTIQTQPVTTEDRSLFASWHPRVLRWFKKPQDVVNRCKGYKDLKPEQKSWKITCHSLSLTAKKQVALLLHNKLKVRNDGALIGAIPAELIDQAGTPHIGAFQIGIDPRQKGGTCFHWYFKEQSDQTKTEKNRYDALAQLIREHTLEDGVAHLPKGDGVKSDGQEFCLVNSNGNKSDTIIKETALLVEITQPKHSVMRLCKLP
jgi:hypothetical protein